MDVAVRYPMEDIQIGIVTAITDTMGKTQMYRPLETALEVVLI